MARPDAEVEVDLDLVCALLRDQHPDLAGLAISELGFGWDNVLFRLGPDLLVRLPRRAASAHLVEHEQRWLPVIGPSLPLPVPLPVRTGEPGQGFPWRWSVVPWIPGRPIHGSTELDWPAIADQLGRFVAAVNHPAPPEAPHNPYRGTSLAEREPHLHAALDRAGDQLAAVGDGVHRGRIESVWSALRTLPVSSEPPSWLHGDLHPLNILVDGGSVSGVVDFGDMAAGDRATDLSLAWLVLPASVRARFRQAAGSRRPVDDATWGRARAWAIALAVAYLSGDEVIAPIGARALAEALANTA
ncbi:MAG: aminoglycoside phosphotransferase family protein [Actinomycetota bacterium]